MFGLIVLIARTAVGSFVRLSMAAMLRKESPSLLLLSLTASPLDLHQECLTWSQWCQFAKMSTKMWAKKKKKSRSPQYDADPEGCWGFLILSGGTSDFKNLRPVVRHFLPVPFQTPHFRVCHCGYFFIRDTASPELLGTQRSSFHRLGCPQNTPGPLYV